MKVKGIMVKLLSVIIFNIPNNQLEPVIIYSAFELSSYGFFERFTVKEVCIVASREYTKRYSEGSNELLKHLNYHVYVRKFHSGIAIASITDEEYPILAAKAFMSKTADIFQSTYPDPSAYSQIKYDTELDIPEIQKLLILCQDPSKADKITAIIAELENTKEIIMKSIDDLLERSDYLDSLLEKSETLKIDAGRFGNGAKELNSCCILF